jgi:beta-lactamase superfamily II metal-dependent hydrolase
MLFTLEAVEAKHGDALLLHYGAPNDPRIILIDGGPSGVWGGTLRDRLEEIRVARAIDEPLPLRLVMVSHIDEDHITGIIELTKDMLRADQNGATRPYRITTVWHNSFDDAVNQVKVANAMAASGADTATATAAEAAFGLGGTLPVLSAATVGAMAAEAQAVIASVKQGRDLRNNAATLGLKVNTGFTEMVVAPKTGAKVRDMGNGLSFTIVGPHQAQLDALQNDWAKGIAKLKAAGKLTPASIEAVAAELLEKTASNLSSIVVLAEANGRRMLLTGDARSDFILDGLKAAGLLPGGKIHVELMKVPHHGSVRNVDQDFFERVTADHYVISANGKFDNPDVGMLKLLFDARPHDTFTLHLTNAVKKADTFIKAHKPTKVKVVRRAKNASSVVVDLGDALSD